MEKVYKCRLCNKNKIFPHNFYGNKECKNCNEPYIFIRNICPICKKGLYKKYEGFVCKNHECIIGGFKLGIGWVFSYSKKNNMQYFKDQYDFDINTFENQKKWLRKKSEIFNERERECEICKSNICLHIHHILSRSENPNLTFDDENLIILCEDYHKKIHSKDKWRFS